MKRRKSIFAPDHELSLDEFAGGSPEGARPREIPGDSAPPDATAYQREQNALLTDAIRMLPVDQRAVVLLRDIEELSTEDTASILDISADAVKQRLHRARLALRKLLAPHLAGFAGRPRAVDAGGVPHV